MALVEENNGDWGTLNVDYPGRADSTVAVVAGLFLFCLVLLTLFSYVKLALLGLILFSAVHFYISSESTLRGDRNDQRFFQKLEILRKARHVVTSSR